MRYPKNLKIGDYIGVTAPSAGVAKEEDLPRLNNVKNNFEKLGYKYIETPNVRTEEKGRSSSAEQRVEQLMSLWNDDRVGAIISATGGDFMAEILDKIDFEAIKKSKPKWYQGYSDNTNLTLLLPTLCDIASIYGQNVKDYGMANLYGNLTNSFEIMQGKEITQNSLEKYEIPDWDKERDAFAGYDLTEPVIWKNLKGEETISFRGRSIGGCFDCVVNLMGTRFDKMKEYIEKYKEDGIVWFLEVFEMSTPAFYINLWKMKNAGLFEHCKGIMFGRPLFVREDYETSYEETLKQFFKDMDIPVIYDVDCGHVSPQLPIVTGAILEVESSNGKGTIKNIFE